MRNFLLECAKKQLITARDTGLAEKTFEDCKSRFTIFHILNYCMYTQAVEAFDALEECGMMRNNVKKHRKMCDMAWDKYQKIMRRSMKESAWYLLQDYCMAAHEDVQHDCDILMLCFRNYLLKNKCKNADVVSRMCVPLKVGDAISTLWPNYFATYKHICGLDFEKDFEYADLSVMMYHLKAITNELSKGNPLVDFGKDISCKNAMTALDYHFANDDFQEKAARRAINYSKTYKPMYEAEISRIKEEQEKR